MIRIVIAGFLGAVVLFMWGFLAWTVLHLHPIQEIPNEDAVVALLSDSIDKPGAYFFPAMPAMHEAMTAEEREQAMDAYADRRAVEPFGLLLIQPDGTEFLHPLTFVRGFVNGLVVALIASIMLATAAGSLTGYFSRLLFVIGFGVLIAFFTHVSSWNWMHYPTDYTLTMVLDTLIAWTLVGLVLAGIIRPKVAGA